MNSIHELSKITLGNYPQSVSIHGNDTNLPILLMLHGGPGQPQIGFIRYFTEALESEFIVVNWDQRGSGKSYSSSIDPATMNINQFLDDTIELTKYLLQRFGKQKLFLCGHSWGTALGLLACQKNPELFEAYIGVSQIVNMPKGELISYNFTLQKAIESNNQKAITELKKIGTPPHKSLTDILLQRKWLDHYNGTTYELKMNKIMQKASSTKEYNLWDWLWRFRKGMFFSLDHLLQDLLNIEFDKSIQEIKIPFYCLEGTSDYQVPFELAQSFFEQIKAPHKKLIMFEQCGHMIPFEQTALFCKTMIEIKNKTL
jgi:pimeloyl-ACP methyl ester carboxylesterase